ncbi:hypothetical protein BV20DRAFT_1067527 [Pilatotrama ljubarskyi]|nr:hypothetical protein BV20DRAFT_1067527 [Pilatotrama ljubarskyi]
MSAPASNIPDSVALSLALQPKPCHWYYSREGLASRKEREKRFKGITQELKKPKKERVICVRAGRLADLMDMPMDIFLEIVTKLHPLDLLRFARVSKHFRSLLMGRKSRHLWVAAFENVPGVPPCPPYVCEPRYAAALFDQYCFACGIERSSNTDQSLSLRLCAPCYKANFMAGNQMYCSTVGLPSKVVELLPTLVVSVVKQSFCGLAKDNFIQKTFYIPEFNAVVEALGRFRSPAERAVFMKERQEYVTRVQTHGVAVLTWERTNHRKKWSEDDAARADRKAAMLDKLYELGHTRADYPKNDAWKKILDQPRRLTDKIWKTARPKLIALIEQKREEDRQAAFEVRLKERRAEFRPLYDAFLQGRLSETDRVYAPNWNDACNLPSLAALASENDATLTVTPARLAAIEHRLVEEIREYASRAKRDLVEMVHRDQHTKSDVPMPPYDMAEIDAELARASSLFICHRCPLKAAVSATAIADHWRTAHAKLKWNDAWPIEEHFDRRRKQSEWPSMLPWVSALPSGYKRTKEALAALALPDDTPYDLVDGFVRESRLLCLCDSPKLPPPGESGWGILLQHVINEMQWYRQKTYDFPRGYTPRNSHLVDNHRLGDAKPCLKLLTEGEQPVFPDCSVPEGAAAEVAALLSERQGQPSCRMCHDMTTEGRRWSGLYMEKDIRVLAHHMKTRCVMRLIHGSGECDPELCLWFLQTQRVAVQGSSSVRLLPLLGVAFMKSAV